MIIDERNSTPLLEESVSPFIGTIECIIPIDKVQLLTQSKYSIRILGLNNGVIAFSKGWYINVPIPNSPGLLGEWRYFTYDIANS